MKIENVPQTYEEMETWAKEYEKRTMLPTEKSHQLAKTTMALLIFYIPSFMKDFVRQILISMMDEPLRIAMMYPPAPAYIEQVISCLALVRGILMRNFFIPRWKPVLFTQREKNKFGRYNTNYADNEVTRLVPALMLAVVFVPGFRWSHLEVLELSQWSTKSQSAVSYARVSSRGGRTREI
jgi:hypothetical protein